MFIIIIPVGVEIGSVLGSLLSCGLLLLTMTMTMSTVTVSMTSVRMSMSMVLMFVYMSVSVSMSMILVFVYMSVSVSMTCDGLNVLHVYALFLQGRVLIFGVGGLTPLEGGSLLCPMGVTVTMIMGVSVTTEHEGQEECDTQGDYQPHSCCWTYCNKKLTFQIKNCKYFSNFSQLNILF